VSDQAGISLDYLIGRVSDLESRRRLGVIRTRGPGSTSFTALAPRAASMKPSTIPPQVHAVTGAFQGNFHPPGSEHLNRYGEMKAHAEGVGMRIESSIQYSKKRILTSLGQMSRTVRLGGRLSVQRLCVK
jgi:hypothetical protein